MDLFLFEAQYVMPSVATTITAKKMEADLRTRLRNKEYDSITSANAYSMG